MTSNMGEPSGIFNAKGRESGGALRARAPNHGRSPIRWNREEVGNLTGFQTGEPPRPSRLRLGTAIPSDGTDAPARTGDPQIHNLVL
jgi:hypothetical protein